MEQALPIIIALLFFGYKQYKKNIDKNPQPKVEDSNYEVESANENKNFGLNDFINTFIEEPKNTVPQEFNEYLPKDEEVDTFEEEEEEIITLEPETKNSEFDNNEDHHIHKKDKQFETSINNEVESTENTDFDLHQAIIYDAILNPPYIDK